MYRLSVPIADKALDESRRERLLAQLKACGVDCVYLSIERTLEEEKFPEICSHLKSNMKFLNANGIETGVWLTTIGHGVSVTGVEAVENEAYTPFTTVEGKRLNEAFCPYDPKFRKVICKLMASLAKTGIKTILVDDDYRMSQHGDNFCCACDLHMKKISEICGEEITRERLYKNAFSGKSNRLRDAWLKAQGDSLRLLAGEMREAVDKVDKSVRMALCSCYSPWNPDGCDPIELARIFAGDNPPLLRTHGAPYWHWGSLEFEIGTPLIGSNEIARMMASLCRDKGIELMAEGDSYPRPRHNVPASCLELFDAAMRADGNHNGILKFMFVSSPNLDYEMGYVKNHIYDSEKLSSILEWFEGGANQGVRIYTYPGLFGEADFDITPMSARTPYPTAGIMLGLNSIPTLYSGKGAARAVFAENALCFNIDEAESGVILDAGAALILKQRGIDTGIEEFFEYAELEPAYEYFCGLDENVTVTNSKAHIARVRLNSGVRIESTVCDGCRDIPLSYSYENESGQRFTVFLFESSSLKYNSGFLSSYARQHQLQRAVEWLSGEELPVSISGNPDLQVMCRKDEEEMSVLLLNCSADRIIEPVLTLSESYKKMECIGCSGKLDKTAATLSTIGAYDFAVLRFTR